MPNSLGFVLKRLRERKHYPQPRVIERSDLEHSANHISSTKTNKTSPTFEGLKALAVVCGTSVFESSSQVKGTTLDWEFTANSDARLSFSFDDPLSTERRKVALEFMQFLAEKERMEKSGGRG